MKKSLFLFIALLSSSVLFSQEIKVPEAVKQKQEERIANREKDGKMVLYTVLLFSGNNKSEAFATKAKFDEKYKGKEVSYETEIRWEEPYFKLYAGKFLTAIEAQKLISELKEWLPNVILVKRRTDYPKL